MGENRESQEAFVTLATNDTYALGCLVLAHSLRRVGTTRKLVVMVSVGVSDSVRGQLGSVFDQIVPVNVLDSSDTCNLALLGRPDLSVTFTKFHCWRLTQFKKCVFMDADTLVIRNIDDLFDREELSAAPDAGWPDCFNSGVFVFEPSEDTYKKLLDYAVTAGSFDGGDQGLLNLFFKNWATEDIKKHLPFTYNVVSQAFYSYLPAFKQFYDNIKVVHFIGAVKPWHHSFNVTTRTVTPLPSTGHSQEFLQVWWDIFMESVQPYLDPQLTLSFQTQDPPPAPPPPPITQHPEPPPVQETRPPSGLDLYGHSNTRGQPATSMCILYPYVPPRVEEEEPAPGAPSSAEVAVPPVAVVDVPIVYRDYQVLETHYSEEPLSSVNPDLPPAEHYLAQGDLTPHPTPTHGADYRNGTPAVQPEEGLQGSPDIIDNGATAEEEEKRSVESLSDSQAGIVGDLANINLQAGALESLPKKDDRERKLQWEQGQADYMGIDRFDNIKARLDEKISQPNSETKLATGESETKVSTESLLGASSEVEPSTAVQEGGSLEIASGEPVKQ
ncbi:glycogenin-1-like isoform X1 [Biomphalaria glabrata]|uniref:glycogenin glucosyltransferase n=2 Tax=Biomphalaria glabrata TaxID=6526 RepID=A0A9W2YY73_BIOGL|nr:glycogenin-1-like isoform X1 [Biomphalaria glabrata]